MHTRPEFADLPDIHAHTASAIRLFLGYRVFLVTVMLIAFFDLGHGPLGTQNPQLFSYAIAVYSAIVTLSLMLGVARALDGARQAMVAVALDIGCIAVLMFASGGVQSGLGMLIAISIALGSICMQGRASILLAAIAALVVIGEEAYAHYSGAWTHIAYTQAGLLGISFFALAGLAHTLAARAQRSEQLARQRGIDLINLAQLNDYVIQQMLAGILVIDDNGRIQVMNESAWVLVGMPLQIEHLQLDHVCPRLAVQFREWRAGLETSPAPIKAINGGREMRAEFTRLGDAGEQGTLIVLEDSTRLTAQAQQMKLASLGRLSAGIAHEIRNPLGAISHAAQLLGESTELNPADRRMAEIIQQNSRRVDQVVQNIFKLSRQNRPTPKPLVLGPWLEQLAEELRRTQDLDQTRLSYRVDPENTTVYADAGQLHQVIEVLCDNAARHFSRDPKYLRITLVAGITPESGGPFIEVRDNGNGIAPEHALQVFDPFFSTRPQGTGLGLYIARQLSEANRIRLEYLPLPDGGSCFRLNFPNPRSTKPA